MQEIVLVLGSVAGACTAVAVDKIPKRKNDKLISRANPIIKSQIESLKIEKDILTKTISRLYQQESELSKIQRDKLLLRYQHQLGLVIAKMEKLEEASKHPDIGPLGDGLILLMDQKLSQLDKRLHEISSKISVATISPQTKQVESIKEMVQEKPIIKKVGVKSEVEKTTETYTSTLPIEVSVPEPHKSVELVTLTEIPRRMPGFPVEFVKPVVTIPQKENVEPVNKQPTEIERPVVKEIESIVDIREPRPSEVTKSESVIEIIKPEHVSVIEEKIKIPSPIKIPEDEKLEDDDKDINKIKSEIMKALSKLEQVEVE